MKTIKYFCALLLFAACNPSQNSDSIESVADSTAALTISFTAEQLSNIQPKFITATPNEIKQTITLNGKATSSPNQVFKVSAPLGGYVRTIAVNLGQFVQKGQPLAQIENLEMVTLQQNYLESKARLQFLKEELKRQENLQSNDATSIKALQKSKMENDLELVNFNSLQTKLDMLGIDWKNLSADKINAQFYITAPVTGQLTAITAVSGSYVDPTAILFEIADTKSSFIVFDLFEKDYAWMQNGDSISIHTAVDPEKVYTTKITAISPIIGSASKSFLTCSVPSGKDFIPGTYIIGEIHVAKIKTLTIPAAAATSHEGQYYVVRKNSDFQFELIAVEYDGKNDQIDVGSLVDKAHETAFVMQGAHQILMAKFNVQE